MPTERTIHGVTDFEAQWAATLAYFDTLAQQYADRAAFYERMGRIARLDNPATRRQLICAETTDRHDPFMEALIEKNGDFREVPFGVVSKRNAN
jgi:hypothetical protein